MTTPIALAALGGFSAGVCASMYYAAGVPSSQVFGPSLVRARNPHAIALTFDDGPSESTPAVLDALAEAGARATFFQVGGNARRLPEMARRTASAGHEIANHTETHPAFFLCSPATIAREIEACQRSLEAVHGRSPRLFRPPYGARWFGMFPALEQNNLQSVMWSVSSKDWKDSAEGIAQRVLTHTRPGDVVLLHDGDTTSIGDHRQATARAVRTILAGLGARGIRAVTVSELFDLTA